MKKKLIFFFIAIILSLYFLISLNLNNEKKLSFFKSFISLEKKEIIKKTIFPIQYKDNIISELNYKIRELKTEIINLSKWSNKVNNNKATAGFISNNIYSLSRYIDTSENNFINKANKINNEYRDKGDLVDAPIFSTKLSNYKILEFDLPLLKRGDQSEKPVGYIDTYKDQIILVSGNGFYILSIDKKSLKEENFNYREIKHNLTEVMSGYRNFIPSKFGIKDVTIIDNFIYVSYTKELKPDCYNLSILKSRIGLGELNFEELSIENNQKCIYDYQRFNPHAGGGRIIELENNKIGLSYGSFSFFENILEKNNYWGKNISIDKRNGEVKILSIGHRNVQGLFFDKKKNIIISTEHGPKGGDEINVVELNQSKIENFGWPKASYGEHYQEKTKKEYPLKKSHAKFGFKEPAHYFVPSVGISEVIDCKKTFSVDCENYEFISSSMGNNSFEGDMSLLFFNLDKKIIQQLPINGRIRDMTYLDNNLLLLLEDRPSIGVLKVD